MSDLSVHSIEFQRKLRESFPYVLRFADKTYGDSYFLIENLDDINQMYFSQDRGHVTITGRGLNVFKFTRDENGFTQLMSLIYNLDGHNTECWITSNNKGTGKYLFWFEGIADVIDFFKNVTSEDGEYIYYILFHPGDLLRETTASLGGN